MKIIRVRNPQEGASVCKKLLYEEVSRNSVLFLSGGSTPKTLYKILAKEKKLNIGAVAMVDERYFPKSKIKNQKSQLPKGTNQFMIEQTGLVRYFERAKVRFYSILDDKNIKETAKDYDETVRYLFSFFPKSVAILGVGEDGHTAGIPAIKKISEKIINDRSLLVSCYNALGSFYKERITLTFLGLLKLDKIIVLVFGEDKKKALDLMFKPGLIAKVPSRFLAQKEISNKVTLITDQLVK